MPPVVARKDALAGQFIRYVINGLAATAVHYGVLRFNIEVLHIPLAAAANALAAVFGIIASFLGSRYFVFRGRQGNVARQGSLFLLVYAGIALLHGLVMYVWADRLQLDYRIGFVLATGMQMTISFAANKFLVFK
ncbi:GtrA family protein [Stenotrophomonas maltophilia]|uniref:GtrA family protein n=1 Tax=Stenotrophomonas maltophilia (strain R551-3) TaxID=391008 RepID=B4SJ49_STRM5|nr:GtrA family protein [Stenotrophomonas maltophilia]ACF50217.1 GtrA family protein [Stenotrophomonas maltophilia R551-3]MBA0394987.1 GtrA family protein [Stenotrophomonas maltophilia]MBH1495332.1 GtrA family protein [Stenotrophomonas maltophilia]MBN4962067.1 GtrA family protein [Stenotrophomonas maltophilia]MBN5142000.1 GtrA family protein [Stenotrophomonas maltophilia]